MNAKRVFTITILFTALIAGRPVFAFVSGSNGSDGAFAPTADTQLIMDGSGIFNFTTVDIPDGVTVTVQKNAGNTPLVILASGDVNILGTLSVDGGNGTDVGPTPAPSDGTPGVGGPGAGDGGRGGIYISTLNSGGSGGRGLGAGRPGLQYALGLQACGGGGGGYGSPGANAFVTNCRITGGSFGGGTYGTAELGQLLGGSGGGGGSGGLALFGSGAGGGGGALLIASSGTVNIADTGAITSNGGSGGNQSGVNVGGAGGGGSGGAIRIVATTITGEGTISALGGSPGAVPCQTCNGGAGGNGRIRLEAENIQRLAFTTPNYIFSAPRPIFLSGFPTLRITSVGGIATPTVPTGDRDVVLPGFTPNPVSVELATTGVPLDTTINVIAKPTGGLDISSVSTGVAGSEANGTASADIELPNGASVLTAQTTFTVTASLGNALKNFAQGEQVERVELAAAPGRGSTTTLITVSGKRYTLPSNAVTMN